MSGPAGSMAGAGGTNGHDMGPPKPGDVILFHDDGASAGRALETLLPLWKQAGLRFAAAH